MSKAIRTWLLMGILGLGSMLPVGTSTAQAAHRGHHRGGHHARHYNHGGRHYNYGRYNYGARRYNYGVRRFGYGGFNGYSAAPYGTYNNYGFLGNGVIPGLGGSRGYGLRRLW